MKSLSLKTKLKYDGSQLRSHFIMDSTGISGDAILSFEGPCSVKEHMVDKDDVAAGEFISSDGMLHFIVEIFGAGLGRTILAKRLLIAIMFEEIVKKSRVRGLFRKGNGIYLGNKKLTVSVATVSPVSGLIHAAVNLTVKGAPRPVLSLKDLGIKAPVFAKDVKSRFCDEMESAKHSAVKVRPVQ